MLTKHANFWLGGAVPPLIMVVRRKNLFLFLFVFFFFLNLEFVHLRCKKELNAIQMKLNFEDVYVFPFWHFKTSFLVLKFPILLLVILLKIVRKNLEKLDLNRKIYPNLSWKEMITLSISLWYMFNRISGKCKMLWSLYFCTSL